LKKKKLGHHLICEVKDCSFDVLNNEVDLVNLLLKSCIDGGAGILGHVSHKFEPQGVTVVVGLSESHCSIHTYPEFGYAAVDVFTCGDHVDTHKILNDIVLGLGGRGFIEEHSRGIPEGI
jgi:S-adenosylmethionine decarboxylase